MSVFRYAPRPKVVDGLTAVPIHLDLVTASIVFDGSTKTTQCTAETLFTVGPDGGYPYFDLRQAIDTASLDGSPLAIADVAHHDFGGGTDTELRILERWLAAGSAHTLGLSYGLATPDAPNARAIIWESGSARLSFDFHLSDLNPSRYLESWLPSNLLFDYFPVQLEVRIVNSIHTHTVLSNGTVSSLGANHWQIDFPSGFAPCSHMLLIEATDRIEQHTTAATLAGGTVVTLDLMKRASDTTLNLSTAATTLAGYLDDFHSSVGAYMHGNRYVAYLTSGPTHSMEYDGGTTSRMSALKHEAFHSWWARGMVPARGEDGWLDEAWTTYNTRSGGPDAVPLDMSDLPVALWTNNPFKRKTHGSSYGHGADVFSGLAADLGITTLLSHMAGIYQDRIDRRYATPDIEAELIRRSGQPQISRYFDRFVYGFGNLPAGSQPDLYLRDATDDIGDTPYSGTFWHSPDVWVRNADDGGISPQSPESGQDNWLYARVHNRGTATARSFVVGFKINIWAGTQFVYPGDWFPLTAAVVGFDLAPGESQVVKASWPKEDIPPAGSHGCLLALVYNSDDAPATGAHVWEDNNLAQRNLTIVDMVADEWAQFAFRIGSQFTWQAQFHTLELVRPRGWPDLDVVITHRRPQVVETLFHSFERLKAVKAIKPAPRLDMAAPQEIRFGAGAATLRPAPGSKLLFEVGGSPCLQSPRTQASLRKDNRGGMVIRYNRGCRNALPIGLRAGETGNLLLRVKAPASSRPGDSILTQLVQRDAHGRVVGGISVQIHIKPWKG
jgi:hypothetical protein